MASGGNGEGREKAGSEGFVNEAETLKAQGVVARSSRRSKCPQADHVVLDRRIKSPSDTYNIKLISTHIWDR